MKQMRVAEKLTRHLSATTACVLAIALLAGSVCGRACSGAMCAVRSATHNAKPNCHGMETSANAPFSVTTRPQTCSLTAATVATLTKPVIESRISFRTVDSIRFVNVTVDSEMAADTQFNSLLRSQDSPPHLLVFAVAPAVLRI